MEALLAATARILVQKGFGGLDTNRIAQRAGVSVGSLYQYFPNKHALVLELIDRHLDRQVEAVHAAISTAPHADLAGSIANAIHGLFEVHRVEPELYSALAELIPRSGRAGRIREIEQSIASLTAGLLRSRNAALPAIDSEHGAWVLVTAVGAVARAAALAGKRRGGLSVERIELETRALVLRYLGLAEGDTVAMKAVPERVP